MTQENAGSQEPRNGARTILIVDAYRGSREGLSASLRSAGWIVDTAGGSWEAVKKMKEGRFDVAVVDADLPPTHGVAVTGWDLARIFRAFNPDGALILVVAEQRPEDWLHAARLEHTELIEKPINPPELRALLASLPWISERVRSGGRSWQREPR